MAGVGVLRSHTMRRWVIMTWAVAAAGVWCALSAVEARAEYGDIVMNREAERAEMPPVIFPHWFHRIRFKCKVCHDDIFVMKAGANDVTMIKIIKGEYCGKCHNGRIAWAPLYCDRCHSGKSQFTIAPSEGGGPLP
ncbi:MAG: c(7)-type cytochrome triheme domain-containing protein [Nitrospirota bacterium]